MKLRQRTLSRLYAFATVLAIAIPTTTGLNAGPAFYNTGVDDTGAQLPGGGLDPHYQLRQLTPGAYTGNANWAPAVAMDTVITWSSWVKPADARWIYITNAANLGQDWGTYELMTTFDLSGYDPSTAVLTGQWALDQYGTIYLNGTLIATLPDQNWNSQLNPFTITSGFVPGTNTLSFDVRFPDGGDGMVVSGASLTAAAFPVLTIASSNGATVSWPTNAVGYTLQSSSAVTGPYANSTNTITIVGTNFSAVVWTPQSTEFFRLKK
jgi:hypothetical protein